MPSLGDLFRAFFTIGVSGFGGVMPWARLVVVERRRWLNEEEFVDALAMCQFVPGPNIVNLSVGLGGRFHGVPGSLVCVVALLGAPMLIIIAASLALQQVIDRPFVLGALHGMSAVATALIVVMTVKVATPIFRRRDWPSMAVAAIAFVVVALLRLPLVPSLLTMAPLAIVFAHLRRRRG
jgi:chromate transporter